MEEFFRELEECLRGEVSEAELTESINYYREYFRDQKAAGMGEQEIVQSLGSPRLIARSIIDARKMAEEQGQTDQGGYYDMDSGRYAEDEERSANVYKTGRKGLPAALVIIIVLLILGVVIRVLLPIALVLIPVFLIFRLFQGNR